MFKAGDIASWKSRGNGSYMICLVLKDITESESSKDSSNQNKEKWTPLKSSDAILSKKMWVGPFRNAEPAYELIGNISEVEKEYPKIMDLLTSADKESVDYGLEIIKQFNLF